MHDDQDQAQDSRNNIHSYFIYCVFLRAFLLG